MLDLLASTRPTSKSDRLESELSPSSMLAVGRTIVTASIDIFTGCKIANRIARRDRVRHPPPMPNCTNWLASYPATLHRIQGFPVHQLARQELQYRLTLASSTVLSKSKLPLSNFRAKAAQSERELTPNCNYSHSSLAKTIKTIN